MWQVFSHLILRLLRVMSDCPEAISLIISSYYNLLYSLRYFGLVIYVDKNLLFKS